MPNICTIYKTVVSVCSQFIGRTRIHGISALHSEIVWHARATVQAKVTVRTWAFLFRVTNGRSDETAYAVMSVRQRMPFVQSGETPTAKWWLLLERHPPRPLTAWWSSLAEAQLVNQSREARMPRQRRASQLVYTYISGVLTMGLYCSSFALLFFFFFYLTLPTEHVSVCFLHSKNPFSWLAFESEQSKFSFSFFSFFFFLCVPVVYVHDVPARSVHNQDDTESSTLNTVKLCIKAVACVQFFNFLVQLLSKCGFFFFFFFFEGGFYAKFWVRKACESSLAHCDMYSESETWLCEFHKIVSKGNKHFGRKKRSNLALLGRYWAAIFKLQFLFECGLSATWVWRKCGSYSSAALTLLLLLFASTKFCVF